jgi:WD40 repeat protein/flagellar motility protein MotE (MotC chaperone)
MAGVVPKLRKKARTAVVVFRDWQSPDFLATLKTNCIEAFELATAQQRPLTVDPTLPLDELLFEAAKGYGGTILILLDQFEEYFLYHRESEAGNSFDGDLARAINCQDVDASFLISLREEGLARLDERFRLRIPNLLGNTVRLHHLDSKAAEEAICNPLAVYKDDKDHQGETPGPVEIDKKLLSAILSDKNMQTGQLLFRESSGVGKIEKTGQAATFEAPLLQLVMTSLWEKGRNAGSQSLSIQTLEALGGTEKIVRSHVDEKLDKLLTKDRELERELCSRIFDHMVTPSGTKIACRLDDLAVWAGEDLKEHVPRVVENLAKSDSRILRTVPGPLGQPVQYEIFHDVLAPAILDWRARYIRLKEQEKARLLVEEQRREAEIQTEIAASFKQLNRRLRIYLGITIGLCFLAIGLGWLAKDQAKELDTKYQELDTKNQVLETQKQELDTKNLKLETQNEAIEDSREKAVASAEEAAKQSTLASSRALSAAALNQARTDPELGVLLALHAVEAAKPLGGNAMRAAVDALGRAIDPARLRFTKKLDGPINTAVLSQDQKRLVVGLDKGDLQVLKWPEGRTEMPLHGLDSKFWRPKFAPTGKLISAIATDNTVCIWNSETGILQHKLTTPGPPQVLGFSADGSMIAVGGAFTAWVWRLGDNNPVSLPGHIDSRGISYTVTAVAFHPHPDKPILATAAHDKTIRLWNLRSREQITLMKGHSAKIDDLEFSPDGKELLSASLDSTARIWDVATGRSRVTLYGHTNSVFSASYSRDGKKIVTGSADATARIWDVESGREIALLASHTEPVSWAGFANQDRQVITASWDGTVKTWSATGHTGRVSQLQYSPDGRVVATAGNDGTVRLWAAATGEELQVLTGHRSPVTRIRFSRNGMRLASGDTSGRIEVWDPSTGKTVASLCCHSDGVEDIAFSPDGSRLVSAAGNDRVALWDVNREVRDVSLTSKAGFLAENVAFSPDGRWIAAGMNDGSVSIWRAADPTQPHQQKAHASKIYLLAFSPNSKMLITAGQDHLAKLWDVASGQIRHELRGHTSDVMDGVFTPDSSAIITSDLKGVIFMWRTGTGDKLKGPPAHAGTCTLDISGNGTRLASFSWDRTAKVWDTKSWRELATLTHREQVDGGAISPDGMRLATYTSYDGVRIVPLEFAELIRLAKTRVTRDLTPDECLRYLNRKDCPSLPR